MNWISKYTMASKKHFLTSDDTQNAPNNSIMCNFSKVFKNQYTKNILTSNNPNMRNKSSKSTHFMIYHQNFQKPPICLLLKILLNQMYKRCNFIKEPTTCDNPYRKHFKTPK